MKMVVKKAGLLLLLVVSCLLLVSMFATEITRAFVHQVAVSPVPLPDGVDIRYSDRLVAIIGKGATGGRAGAVTLGYVILVPRQYRSWSAAVQQRVIRHELIHVRQRQKFWRFYLPLYGVLYVIHGYSGHPFERE